MAAAIQDPDLPSTNTAPRSARPESRSGPAPRLPAARRRRQLLGKALCLFAEGGFHQTSMDDIAEAAGVTKPVVYQHFRSKRALIGELLDDVGRQLMEVITSATAAAPDPRARVLAGFAAYFRFVADNEACFWVLFGSEARRDYEFNAIVLEVEEAIASVVAEMIEAGVEPDHQQTLAHALVGMAEGTSRLLLRAGPNASGVAATTAAEVARRRAEFHLLAERTAELAWAGLRGVSPSAARPG
ncbi:MAG: TetR/AcrR family transcriptional regulator [Acidimicrobiales bacterium]